MNNLEHIKKEAGYLNQNKPKSKFVRFTKIAFFILLVIFIVSSSFSYKVIFSQDSIIKGIGQLPVIKQIRKIVGLDGKIKGEMDNRTNFLILGQGGVGHEGPYLTDTIIFGSIKPSTGQVVMISIPRDFLVEVPGKGWYKINAVNSFGETGNYDGGGSKLVADIVSDIFDLPVHYWIRVDFDSFNDIINSVGHIEVCVERSFTDNLYPTDDFQYQTLEFTEGCQTMDGDTALKFARSRHGTNGEGSDFARAARQQKVILSLKDKVFDWKTVFKPNLIYSLFEMSKDHVQTNVTKGEIVHFIDLAQKIIDNEIKKRVLDNSPTGLLKAEITEQGAYVLVPRSGNYSELRNLAQNIFVLSEQPQEPSEEIKIVILNGTEVEGLARDTAGFFTSLSYEVLNVANSPRQNYEKNVIYDLSDGKKKEYLKILREALDANATKELPEFISTSEIEKIDEADFIVVLGCKEGEPKCVVEEEIEEENI